jgi:hypothetical protein
MKILGQMSWVRRNEERGEVDKYTPNLSEIQNDHWILLISEIKFED